METGEDGQEPEEEQIPKEEPVPKEEPAPKEEPPKPPPVPGLDLFNPSAVQKSKRYCDNNINKYKGDLINNVYSCLHF